MTPNTPAERLACQWLTQTLRSNSEFPILAPYFQQLLDAGWTEEEALQLHSRIFSWWNAVKQVYPERKVTFPEYCKLLINQGIAGDRS
ncbi:MAG TPA: hypothetical protein V6C65_04055 [Allocoleopsis sp.]